MACKGGRIPFAFILFLGFGRPPHGSHPSSLPQTAVLVRFDAEEWLRAIILVRLRLSQSFRELKQVEMEVRPLVEAKVRTVRIMVQFRDGEASAHVQRCRGSASVN